MFGQQTAAVGSSKPVCKYFVKGKCKYGTQCWNYHPPNQGGNTMPNSFLGGSSNVFGGGKANTQQEAKNEFQDFVKQVSGEMTQWERSGQWLVSSFSPLKGHPPFSGFHDTSPEEFRLKAYEALKTNTSSAYQAHWSEMQQRFKQFRDAIKTSTPEAFQAMTEVFFNKNSTEGQPEQQQQQQQQQAFKQPGMFEKPTGPNVFGGASQSTSGGGVGLLGAKPQSSVFGATPAVFGGNQSTSSSVFGGNVNKPVFGGQSMLGAQNMATFPNQSSNLFGGNNNTFTNTNQSTQASNLFGGNQSQTNNNSMFGSSNNNTSVVQNQTTSNVFGEQNKGPTTATTGTNNMFNNPNQASMFGGSATPTTTTTTMISQGNLFGNQQQQQQPQQQQTSLFGNPQQQQQQPQQTSLFGNPPPQQQQQQQTSIFGNPQQQQQQQPQQQTSSVFGSTSVFGNNPTNQPPTQTTPTQPSATPSVFGGTPATKPANNNNNIFGGFGGSNTQSGNAIFGGNAATSSSVFASPSTNTGTGFFGKPSSDSIQPSGSTSIFGDTTLHSQAQGYYGSVAREHPEWYTPLDQLKQEEKAQFEAEAFTLIPLCPPPVELCA